MEARGGLRLTPSSTWSAYFWTYVNGEAVVAVVVVASVVYLEAVTTAAVEAREDTSSGCFFLLKILKLVNSSAGSDVVASGPG